MTDTIVTGAPGWLGSRLIHALVNGLPDLATLATPTERRIRVLVHDDSPSPALSEVTQAGVEIVSGDIRNPAAVAKLLDGTRDATLFHAAGVIHPGHTTSAFESVNVGGTKNLLDAADGHVKRFVYVSSNSPLGVNRSPDDVFDEDAPYRPYMGYGRSKMAAEQLVTAAHAADKLETVTIRPPWFYGPNQPARQSLFFQMVRTGKFPLLGNGTQKRSMAYVDNICQGLLLAERTAPANGQTYWIADKRPYAMTEILETIQRVMSQDFGVEAATKQTGLPGFLGTIAQIVDATLQKVGLYHQKIHVLSEMNKTIACSTAKAERELGYAPAVELEEGMRRSLGWMKTVGQEW
jgi:nucleoside-diphosphate-sugar epimerase